MLRIDLPMPEACDVCLFNYDFVSCEVLKDEEWEKYRDDWHEHICEREERPEYCPLEEYETEDISHLTNARIFSCKECGYGIDDIFITNERIYPIHPVFCPNCGKKVKV